METVFQLPTMDLREELIKYVNNSRLTAKEIAAQLEIDYQKFSKWMQRRSHPKDDLDRQKIRNLVNGKFSIDEKDENAIPDRPTKFQWLITERRASEYDNDPLASSGTITTVDNVPAILMEYIDAPFIGFVEGVVEVSGDSMQPTLKSGDRLAIKQLQDKTLLMWGELYYVIDKNLQGTVKRIYEWEKGIILISDHQDNSKYPPVKRTWDQIEAIFKVKADITKH